MDPLSPTSVPALRGYALLRELGAGAAGVVYEARAEGGDGAALAIKVLHEHLANDEQLRGRFLREAQILASLRGPSICPVIAVGETERALPYMVMPKLEGSKLSALPPLSLPTAEAVQIVQHVCRALETAHAAGVVHRDLKPDNVVICAQQITVVDFGMAKVLQTQRSPLGSELTAAGMIFGTAAYMAPEQARGEEVDERCDVYAAGMILYELLSGEVPLREHNDVLTLIRVSREPLPELTTTRDDVGPLLRAAVMRAVAHHAPQRFESARAFRKALEQVFAAGELQLPAVPSAPATRPVVMSVPASALPSALPPVPGPAPSALPPVSSQVVPPAPLPPPSTQASPVLASPQVVPPAPLPPPSGVDLHHTAPSLGVPPPSISQVNSSISATTPSIADAAPRALGAQAEPGSAPLPGGAAVPSSRRRAAPSSDRRHVAAPPVQHTPAYLRAKSMQTSQQAARRSSRRALGLLWGALALLAVLVGIYLALRRTAG